MSVLSCLIDALEEALMLEAKELDPQATRRHVAIGGAMEALQALKDSQVADYVSHPRTVLEVELFTELTHVRGELAEAKQRVEQWETALAYAYKCRNAAGHWDLDGLGLLGGLLDAIPPERRPGVIDSGHGPSGRIVCSMVDPRPTCFECGNKWVPVEGDDATVLPCGCCDTSLRGRAYRLADKLWLTDTNGQPPAHFVREIMTELRNVTLLREAREKDSGSAEKSAEELHRNDNPDRATGDAGNPGTPIAVPLAPAEAQKAGTNPETVARLDAAVDPMPESVPMAEPFAPGWPDKSGAQTSATDSSAVRANRCMPYAGATYRHHRGGLYTVLGIATESTNDRVLIPVVVYVSLTTGRIRVRALAEFTEVVPWPDGFARARFIPDEVHLNEVG